MRYTLIILFFAIVVFGCARKTIPAAPAVTTTTTAPVPMEPDAIKMDSAAVILSPEKMVALGHDTYTAKCGRCHELKKVDNYSVAEWEPIMADMAFKARLADNEKKNVVAYVNANAKK